jgi:hypothetical protein
MKTKPWIDHQKAVLREFVKAQHAGHVVKIDMELKRDSGKIIYEPASAMYRNNEYCDESEYKTYTDDLKDAPDFEKLHVYFSDNVPEGSIDKIQSYVTHKYKCVCNREKNKLTLSL